MEQKINHSARQVDSVSKPSLSANHGSTYSHARAGLVVPTINNQAKIEIISPFSLTHTDTRLRRLALWHTIANFWLYIALLSPIIALGVLKHYGWSDYSSLYSSWFTVYHLQILTIVALSILLLSLLLKSLISHLQYGIKLKLIDHRTINMMILLKLYVANFFTIVGSFFVTIGGWIALIALGAWLILVGNRTNQSVIHRFGPELLYLLLVIVLAVSFILLSSRRIQTLLLSIANRSMKQTLKLSLSFVWRHSLKLIAIWAYVGLVWAIFIGLVAGLGWSGVWMMSQNWQISYQSVAIVALELSIFGLFYLKQIWAKNFWPSSYHTLVHRKLQKNVSDYLGSTTKLPDLTVRLILMTILVLLSLVMIVILVMHNPSWFVSLAHKIQISS